MWYKYLGQVNRNIRIIVSQTTLIAIFIVIVGRAESSAMMFIKDVIIIDDTVNVKFDPRIMPQLDCVFSRNNVTGRNNIENNMFFSLRNDYTLTSFFMFLIPAKSGFFIVRIKNSHLVRVVTFMPGVFPVFLKERFMIVSLPISGIPEMSVIPRQAR